MKKLSVVQYKDVEPFFRTNFLPKCTENQHIQIQ